MKVLRGVVALICVHVWVEGSILLVISWIKILLGWRALIRFVL